MPFVTSSRKRPAYKDQPTKTGPERPDWSYLSSLHSEGALHILKGLLFLTRHQAHLVVSTMSSFSALTQLSHFITRASKWLCGQKQLFPARA